MGPNHQLNCFGSIKILVDFMIETNSFGKKYRLILDFIIINKFKYGISFVRATIILGIIVWVV